MERRKISWAALPLAVTLALMGQAVALAWIRSGTSFDGAEQLLYTQYLDWGYGRSQPPLYTWLLWGMQRVFGVSLLAEHLLKFGLMAAGLWAIWACARRLGADAPGAAAALLSAFFVVEIGWEFQRNYAHSVLLFALTGALALAYLRGAILWCGVLAGLMVLSKYNAALVIAALVLADLATPGARRFARPSALGALGFACLICAPHGIWAVANPSAVFAMSESFLAQTAWPAAALRALGAYLLASLGVCVVLLMFVAAARARLSLPTGRMARVFGLWALLFWGLGLILAVVAGLDRVNMRWLLPGLVPALPLFAAAVLAARPGLGPWLRVTGLALACIFTAGQWWESTRINARTDYDYGVLAAALEQEGLPDILVISDYALFANLRLYRDVTVLAPAVPNVSARYADRMTMVATPEAFLAIRSDLRALGWCPDGEAREVSMPRRSVDAVRAVAVQPVVRGGC